MMLGLVIICVVFFFKGSTASCEAENQYKWSYHGTTNGPHSWKKNFEKCGMREQSPIEIRTSGLSGGAPEISYNNFDKPVTSATVENKGWSVIITPNDGVERSIKRGRRTYNLKEIRFHFLSEHLIENKRYAMEVQFMIGETARMNPIASFLKGVDGAKDGLKPIVEVLPNVMYRGDSTSLQSQLDLAALLPKNDKSYYEYRGSDTVPPCDLGYQWIVLKDIGEIGNDDLKTFKSLYSVGKADASDSCRMENNVRPKQPLENRQVQSSD